MRTFSDLITKWQKISGDYSLAGKEQAKDDLNEGGQLFMARLSRSINQERRKTTLKAGQQYYQLSVAMLRPSEIRVLQGNGYYPLELVTSERDWNWLNQTSIQSTMPTHFFVQGNEVGVFPIPSADITNGMIVSFEPAHIECSQDDYTVGTVTVAVNSNIVTHSATGFQQQMVGRWLQITDGTHGAFYQISEFVSASQVKLANFYEGISSSGRTFRIGEVMKIPEPYQLAPLDYALDLHFQAHTDEKQATAYERRFEKKIRGAKETYARPTSRIRSPAGSILDKGNQFPNFTNEARPISYP